MLKIMTTRGSHESCMRRWLWSIFIVCFCVSGVYLYRPIRDIGLYYDWTLLDGRLIRTITGEPSLQKYEVGREYSFNYEWLSVEGNKVIRHRGGDYLRLGQNTLAALSDSIEQEFNFVELDFTINLSGQISILTDDMPNKNFDNVMRLLQTNSRLHLIVDFKGEVHDIEKYTAFVRTFKAHPAFQSVSGRIIFQAYNLMNLAVLQDQRIATGPILTVYRLTVPLEVTLAKARNLRIPVVTMPLQYFESLGSHSYVGKIYVHPAVGKDLVRLRQRGLYGIYCSRECFQPRDTL